MPRKLSDVPKHIIRDHVLPNLKTAASKNDGQVDTQLDSRLINKQFADAKNADLMETAQNSGKKRLKLRPNFSIQELGEGLEEMRSESTYVAPGSYKESLVGWLSGNNENINKLPYLGPIMTGWAAEQGKLKHPLANAKVTGLISLTGSEQLPKLIEGLKSVGTIINGIKVDPAIPNQARNSDKFLDEIIKSIEQIKPQKMDFSGALSGMNETEQSTFVTHLANLDLFEEPIEELNFSQNTLAGGAMVEITTSRLSAKRLVLDGILGVNNDMTPDAMMIGFLGGLKNKVVTEELSLKGLGLTYEGLANVEQAGFSNLRVLDLRRNSALDKTQVKELFSTKKYPNLKILL